MGIKRKITVTCDLEKGSQPGTFKNEEEAERAGWVKMIFQERLERWVCPNCVKAISEHEKLRVEL